MPQTQKSSCPRQEEAPCCDRADFLHTRREAVESTAMCRYSHSIPGGSACGCGCSCGCCGGCCGGCGCREQSNCCTEILAAMEQQNNLLCELLAAVSGLTAACLCRNRDC